MPDTNLSNRPLSYTDIYGNVIQYGYDAVGNLTTLTYPDGKAVYYTYDDANRLTTVTDWAGRTTSHTYDANNRLETTTRPDGSVETRTYDSQGQVTAIRDEDQSGTILNEHSYTYDANGNVLTDYNPAVTEEYTDPAEETVTMTYGPANRLATYNGEPVSYDADGNMTIGPLGDNMAASFTCDARNRLTGAGGLTYNYDALDNRVKITDAQGNTTRIVVNPNAALSQVLMETDGQGNILKYYVYGLGLISSQDATDYRLYRYNRRGDTVALTNLSGEVTDRMAYDAYGMVVSRTGTTQTPYLFSGQYGVATDINGLVHMRARYYNPQTMSFTSQDTLLGSLGDIKSLNRYAYAHGNPIIYVDPSGHITLSVGFNFSGSAVVMGSGAGVISIDNRGNIAIQVTATGGLSIGSPGVSGTGITMVTNAPTVVDLTGPSNQAGVSIAGPIGLIPAAFGAEIVTVPDSQTSKNYHGLILGAGLGAPGAEVHSEAAYTKTVAQVNIPDFIKGIFVKDSSVKSTNK